MYFFSFFSPQYHLTYSCCSSFCCSPFSLHLFLWKYFFFFIIYLFFSWVYYERLRLHTNTFDSYLFFSLFSPRRQRRAEHPSILASKAGGLSLPLPPHSQPTLATFSPSFASLLLPCHTFHLIICIHAHAFIGVNNKKKKKMVLVLGGPLTP